MMAYCTWSDVTDILEQAGDIITSSADQTAELNLATELADDYLSPLMNTPVQVDDDGEYPAFVVRFTALLCADLAALRRSWGEDDIIEVNYDGHIYTGTKWGHRAMSMLQAKRIARLAIPDDVTPAEMQMPFLVKNFTTTDGEIQVKYSAGLFMDEKKAVYEFTISSAAGDIANDTLTVSCTRDGDETIWTDRAITGTGWYSVQHGLLVRFIDGDAPAWTQDETFTVTCHPLDAQVKSEGPRSFEIGMG